MQRLSVEYVNEAKEYYLYNGTGNVTQTTAQNGSAFLRYTYDPFGNVTSINAPMLVDIDDLNRYTYNGEDYDFNTGLQYLRARYYSTSTGSFISQDTYLGSAISAVSLNRYTYTGNSPVMFADPSGNSSWLKSAANWIGEKFDSTVEAVGNFVDSAVETVADFAVKTYNDAKTFVAETVDSAKHAAKIASCKAQAFIIDPLVAAATTAKAAVKFVKENAAEIAVVAGTAVVMAGAVALTAVCPAAAPLTGGVMAAGMDLIGQITSGAKVSDVDWMHVGLSGVSGAVTSTLTMVGAGPLAMSVSGAITGGGMELYNQYKQGAPINWGQVAVSTLGGAASGAIAGKINSISKTANAAQAAGKPVDCASINRQISNLEKLSVVSNFAESTAGRIAGGDNLVEAVAGGFNDFTVGAVTDYGISKLNRLGDCFCFVAGTPVLTAAGLVAIEAVEVGDTVIATDPETGETAEKVVNYTFINETDELVHLIVNGEEITSTPGHKFYAPEKGWTSAIELDHNHH